MPVDAVAPRSSSAGARRAGQIVAFFVAAATAIFLVAALAGIANSLIVPLVVGGALAVLVGYLQWRRPTVSIDVSGCSRALLAVSLAASVLALVFVSRLAVFMIDPAQTAYSTLPSSDWEIRHSCLTAYFVAGDVVRRTPNVYDTALYAAPDDDPGKPRKPAMMGLFRVDQYEYPPPFLLAPHAVSLIAPGFLRLRPTWFGLSGLVLLAGLLVAAREMAPAARTRALLLAPVVLGALVTLNTLQKGNVQVVVIAVSVLAMAAIERRQRAVGGALLAFITVAKLYPGLLIVYLLARRDWRALAWTAVFGAAFLVLTVIDMGWQPFAAFREHFSGLLSGEAFPAFRNPSAVAINLSIPGIVFKLHLFGIGDMRFGAARLVGTLYMLVAVVATVILARRAPRDGHAPLVWLTVVLLATLRSPFLPWTYATIPALWLLTLMAAAGVPRTWTIPQFLVAALVLGVMIPMDFPLDPPTKALLSIAPQLLMLTLAFWCFRSSDRTVDSSSWQAPAKAGALSI